MIIICLILFFILLQVAVNKKENILSFIISKKKRPFGVKYSETGDKILKAVDDIFTGFEVLKNRHILLLSILMTVCSRLVMYFGVFFLLKGVGLNFTFWEIVFLSSFYILLPLLPINTFGGFGTTEALLVILIMSFGYSKEPALIASFQIHIIQLAIAVLLGLFGFFQLWLERRQSRLMTQIS